MLILKYVCIVFVGLQLPESSFGIAIPHLIHESRREILQKINATLESKFGKVERKIENVESRLLRMEREIGQIKSLLNNISGKLDINLLTSKENVVQTTLMQNEIFSLMEIPNAVENYLQEQQEVHEKDSSIIIHHQNSSTNFPLLQLLVRNAIHKNIGQLAPVQNTSCYTLFRWMNYLPNGVYDILPFDDKQNLNQTSIAAYCDTNELGEGWTVFQRRGIPSQLTDTDRSDLFNKTWMDYKNGFGDPNSDYWLGLDAIHTLTKNCNHRLLIKAISLDGSSYRACYSTFRVASEENQYKLTVNGFLRLLSSFDGNSFTEDHNGKSFSTSDIDNDENLSGSCSRNLSGGFWFGDCGNVLLNGIYPNAEYPNTLSTNSQEGMAWYIRDQKSYLKLKRTEMMIRPDC